MPRFEPLENAVAEVLLKDHTPVGGGETYREKLVYTMDTGSWVILSTRLLCLCPSPKDRQDCFFIKP